MQGVNVNSGLRSVFSSCHVIIIIIIVVLLEPFMYISVLLFLFVANLH